MAAFIIADIRVENFEAYQEYIEKVPALIAKHQGIYRARGGAHAVPEGSWQPGRLVILEFPDREHAEAFYNDPAYAELKLIRQSAAETNLVIVDGL